MNREDYQIFEECFQQRDHSKETGAEKQKKKQHLEKKKHYKKPSLIASVSMTHKEFPFIKKIKKKKKKNQKRKEGKERKAKEFSWIINNHGKIQ